MMGTSGELHPLLTHHVVNTLGWPRLRDLQQASLAPVRAGQHTLVVAPTAGGKTEAAIFPLLSEMLEQQWTGLSVLYLCPLRALLNNLHPRLEQYCELVGRRAGLWHGDVGESDRERIRSDPPDVLLTTPESIEAMLISRKTDHAWLFKDLRAIVVDEIHAFAGDDRGWHLLAVAERVSRLAGRELQRVGLSATVGNPEQLLDWFTRTCTGDRTVVAPQQGGAALASPEVTLDYVGSTANAATVISRLHRGEKRLVFVDSRRRVEELAVALRERDVTTFVSHGSLGREERRAAELAFAEARDCVIVATSTLELGIDVGDLDRVIQLDAPPGVASLLQRLGRTGRRAGQQSNLLVLATKEEALIEAAGILHAWEQGYVEPLTPPPFALHLLVQQLLAILLQENGAGRATWSEWLGDPLVLGQDLADWTQPVVDLLEDQNVVADDQGILWLGPDGERRFGKRNFLDLMAVFSDPPVLTVVAGRTEIGQIPTRLLLAEPESNHVILLAGRHWIVKDVDWRRRVVTVEATGDGGKVRWEGTGRGLPEPICRSIRAVLAGADLTQTRMSQRATDRLGRLRDDHWWVGEGDSVVVQEPNGRSTWWTFAGLDANLWLASALGDLRSASRPSDDLSIRLAPECRVDDVKAVLAGFDPVIANLDIPIAEGLVEQLKFADLLPDELATRIVTARVRDDDTVRAVARRSVRGVHLQQR